MRCAAWTRTPRRRVHPHPGRRAARSGRYALGADRRVAGPTPINFDDVGQAYGHRRGRASWRRQSRLSTGERSWQRPPWSRGRGSQPICGRTTGCPTQGCTSSRPASTSGCSARPSDPSSSGATSPARVARSAGRATGRAGGGAGRRHRNEIGPVPLNVRCRVHRIPRSWSCTRSRSCSPQLRRLPAAACRGGRERPAAGREGHGAMTEVGRDGANGFLVPVGSLVRPAAGAPASGSEPRVAPGHGPGGPGAGPQ